MRTLRCLGKVFLADSEEPPHLAASDIPVSPTLSGVYVEEWSDGTYRRYFADRDETRTVSVEAYDQMRPTHRDRFHAWLRGETAHPSEFTRADRDAILGILAQVP